MKGYTTFCKRYDLNPDAPDSREQYRQYQEAYEIMQTITMKD